MRVCFVDTNYEWHDRDNVIFQSLIRLRENVTICNRSPDILITKAFGNAKTWEMFDCAKWLYTIESPCPKHPKLDFNFTHDPDSDTNAYFPCYHSWINYYNEVDRHYPEYLILPKYLDSAIPLKQARRNTFSAFWTANGPLRSSVTCSLESMGFAVEKYGAFFGKASTTNKSKWLNMLETKYNLAFENRLYPGYHTEKIVEAKAAGTIPIYYGHTDMKNLNQDACLNLANYEDHDERINAILDLVNDESKQRQMIETPLFHQTPTAETVMKQVERGLKRVSL
jgi:hypothetical protein